MIHITKFVDQNGTPVSHEAAEDLGFTMGMQFDGQGYMRVLIKGEIMQLAFRVQKEEDFLVLAKIAWMEYKRKLDETNRDT